MAKGPRPATFDVAAAARNAPFANRRTPWMADDAGDLAAAALEHHPKKYRIKPEEVETLVERMATLQTAQHRMAVVSVGGVDHHLRDREVRFEGVTLHHTPTIPGLFLSGEIPEDPGMTDRAVKEIRRQLRALRHDEGMVVSVVQRQRRNYGFDTAEVYMREAEGPGTYREYAALEHRTPAEFEREIGKVVANAIDRHKLRFHLMGARHGAEEWARHMASTVDGVEFVRAGVSNFSYERERDRVNHIAVRCVFKGLGDRLEEQELECTGHDDTHFKSLVAGHRRAVRKLKASEAVDARTVHPVVAAAVRARMDEHGAQILEEIEAALEGRHVPAMDTVARGITAFRMEDGELHAPTTLAKGLKFEKKQIIVRRVKDLPTTILAALPGQPLTNVVEHPWLEGLNVRTAILNGKGLCMRHDYACEPLAPLLAELRERFATPANA